MATSSGRAGHRDAVERADAVGRDAERLGHDRRGDEPDAQAGERAGPGAGDDRVQVARFGVRVAQAGRDHRGEVLAVPARVDRLVLGDRFDAIVGHLDERGRNCRRRGVERENQHDVPAYGEAATRRLALPNRRRAGRAARCVARIGGALDLDLQSRVGKLLDLARAPLDDRHRVVGRDVEIEIVDLVQRAEPVGVDVHERESAAMHAGDDEGRRHDVALHAEAGADALHERGLAGTERSAEHDQIAGAQDAARRRPNSRVSAAVGSVDHRRPALVGRGAAAARWRDRGVPCAPGARRRARRPARRAAARRPSPGCARPA